MPNQVTVTYCGVESTGRTVTEAKQSAARRIESFARTGPSPSIIAAGPWAMLFYRDLSGWCASIIATPDGFRTDYLSGSHYGLDKSDVERSARRHLADLATDWRTCFTADDVDPCCLDKADRKEIACKAAWQRRYHAYKARGFNDNQCHHLASQFGHIVDCEQIAECDAA